MIDTEHRIAELFHITNVPTMIWIDEEGRICRPHDAQFGTDTFTAFHGKHSGPYLDMVRAWVRSGAGAMTPEDVRKHQTAPSEDAQLARVERAVAWHLHQKGREEAATRHFERAAELAPNDWTIRRGSMPIRGEDPFGPGFFKLAEEGVPTYLMDTVTQTREES